MRGAGNAELSPEPPLLSPRVLQPPALGKHEPPSSSSGPREAGVRAVRPEAFPGRVRPDGLVGSGLQRAASGMVVSTPEDLRCHLVLIKWDQRVPTAAMGTAVLTLPSDMCGHPHLPRWQLGDWPGPERRAVSPCVMSSALFKSVARACGKSPDGKTPDQKGTLGGACRRASQSRWPAEGRVRGGLTTGLGGGQCCWAVTVEVLLWDRLS